MKSEGSHNNLSQGIIKDTLVIILLFSGLSFVGIRIAAFAAIICSSLLLTRRLILEYNPGFIIGHHIMHKEKELIIPKGIDVFDLSKVPSMPYFQRYTDVIRGIIAPPAVLILRFCSVLYIEEYDLLLLSQIIGQLQKSNIAVVFSDVKQNVHLQFSKYNIQKKLGGQNICKNISDALEQAEIILHKAKIKQ